MKKTIAYIAVMILGSSSLAWAQQDVAVTQFNELMLLYNPAYAGNAAQAKFSSAYIKEWSGAPIGSPQTNFFSFDKPLAKGLGLGLSFINDKTFVENIGSTSLDFSYKVQVSELTRLYFGIRASAILYNLNASSLVTNSLVADPSLIDTSIFSSNVGFGMRVVGDKWDFSLAVPRFFKSNRVAEDNGVALLSSSKTHLYGSLGYNYSLNESGNLVLKPAVLFRYAGGSPMAYDALAMLDIKQKYSVGLSYRSTQTLAGIAALDISDSLRFGASYGFSSNEQLVNRNSNYEFFLKINL